MMKSFNPKIAEPQGILEIPVAQLCLSVISENISHTGYNHSFE